MWVGGGAGGGGINISVFSILNWKQLADIQVAKSSRQLDIGVWSSGETALSRDRRLGLIDHGWNLNQETDKMEKTRGSSAHANT